MTKLEFLKRVSNNYDYSLISEDIDIKYKSYIEIICKRHGIKKMRADVLMRGGICRECKNEDSSAKNEIINRFREKYSYEYEYDISNFKNINSKIRIICKKHGDFYTSSIGHINGKCCSICKSENYQINEEERQKNFKIFLDKCEKKYNGKYDYSKVIYERSDKKIVIICNRHGEFLIRPSSHISGTECKKCRYDIFSTTYSHTTDQFLNSVKEVHGNFYDYSKVNYINDKTKVEIICPNHGLFKQAPHEHKIGYGCPECNITIGERKISVILQRLNIIYEFQKIFDDCIFINKLKFDFYLPEYKICIEYDGIQHFEPIEYFGGEDSFNKRRERDRIKEKYCEDNDIFLLRIPYFIQDIESCIKSILM